MEVEHMNMRDMEDFTMKEIQDLFFNQVKSLSKKSWPKRW
jgi:hypothetical protein